MVGVNMAFHGAIGECLVGAMLEPCLLKPCFHVAGMSEFGADAGQPQIDAPEHGNWLRSRDGDPLDEGPSGPPGLVHQDWSTRDYFLLTLILSFLQSLTCTAKQVNEGHTSRTPGSKEKIPWTTGDTTTTTNNNNNNHDIYFI